MDNCYVACSRVGKPSDLFVYTPEGKTEKKIIFKSSSINAIKTKYRVSFKLNWRRSKARRVQLVSS
jgi:hypothetical protein